MNKNRHNGGGGGYNSGNGGNKKERKWAPHGQNANSNGNGSSSSAASNRNQQPAQPTVRNDYDRDRNAFLPPAADNRNEGRLFKTTFESGWLIPQRLCDKRTALIEAVNDFHYAMLNDEQRNEFYLECLKRFINPESIVLEIGTGTGLLAMLAAQAGAKKIYAIEANRDMAQLARNNIAANHLSEKITVINKLSFEVTPADLNNNTPNVVLSEVFGTLLLGESVHVYVHDVLRRLCEPSTAVIPRYGRQYALLIHSPDLERVTSVKQWNGIDLSTLNSLKDTVSVVFTKSYGFRFSTMPYQAVAEKVAVLDLDFATVDPQTMAQQAKFVVKAKMSGVIHAVLLFWEAYSDDDHTHVMSTDPESTANNFARDMQWGQALQLMEDFTQNRYNPTPFVAKEGEDVEVYVRFSSDGVLMQFDLRHAPTS